MIITNVGIAMDTIKDTNMFVIGRGTIYSKDEDGLELEYEDDFSFEYDKELDKANCRVAPIFEDYKAEIIETLIDNLKINYLQNK